MTAEPTADVRQSRFLGSPRHEIRPQDTALLVIDMQYLDAHVDYGMCRKARDAGESLTYYAERLQTATASIARLLEAFRAKAIPVIYCRIASLTMDGRDRSLAHKRAGLHAPPGSRESMILDEIAPLQGEIVLTKAVSSVFVGTNIDYLLRNMEIRTLVMTGVLTSGCVEAAVRDAHDRNYNVILVEDACADLSRDFHHAAVEILRPAAMVTNTGEVVQAVNALPAPNGS